GNHGSRVLACPVNHGTRDASPHDEIDIRPQRGNDHRLVEVLAQQNCCDAVGIEIVRIDEIEIESFVQQLSYDTTGSKRQAHGRKVSAEFGNDYIARMVNLGPDTR